MGCYICKLLFSSPLPMTEENLFHFYYKWNPKKIRDPNFLTRILAMYSKNNKNLFLDLEDKYGMYPEIYDETMYIRYIEHRLYNLYKEYTTRIEQEGIGFIFQLTEQYKYNLNILMSQVISRYGLETHQVEFPLRSLMTVYEEDYAAEVAAAENSNISEDIMTKEVGDIDIVENHHDGWDVVN